MITTALVVENVGKAYVKYASELTRIASWFGARGRPMTEHWVLEHINFKVDAGESVGIIGQNGAGKSTLLKLVTGTILPTSGQVVANGKVSALLELGLGFNSELTGRENVRHAAGLMGLSANEIDRLMPGIEAFAEIGEYFDQPIRTYSSGMQMRVSFSVATAIRPEILIVDEALSVGDAYFVHKSFQRIREFREKGTTLLFVSHDAAAILSLCDRAILLSEGRLLMDATPQAVLDYYNALIAEKENSTVRSSTTSGGQVSTESGTGEAVIESLELVDESEQPTEYVAVAQPVALRARVRVMLPVGRLVFGYMIKDRLGETVYGTNTYHTAQDCGPLHAGEELEFIVRFPANLGPGSYSISVALTSTETHLVNNYHWRDLAVVFSVANTRFPQFIGSSWIQPEIEILRGQIGNTEINRHGERRSGFRQ